MSTQSLIQTQERLQESVKASRLFHERVIIWKKNIKSLKMMEVEEDEMDILPDTDVDRERTMAGKWALFVLVRF